MQLFKDFTNLYPISKTLRFELKPVFETMKFVKQNDFIKKDEIRSEEYKIIKKSIDEVHKLFVEEILQNTSLGDAKANIKEYFTLYKKREKSDEEKQTIKDIQSILRQFISDKFTKHEDYKTLFSKDMIQKNLPNYLSNELKSTNEEDVKNIKEQLQIAKNFYSFTTYFTGFHENRKNMYTKDEKNTAISFRVINENIPIFFDNIIKFEKISSNEKAYESCNNLFLELKKSNNISTFETLGELFDLSCVNKIFTQNQIDTYNLFFSGNKNEINQKKGLNSLINEFNQKEKLQKSDKLPLFKFLKKQILSEKTTYSFITEKFENDREIKDSLENLILHVRNTKLLENMQKVLKSVENRQNLWIKKLEINTISNRFFGDFAFIERVLRDYFENVLIKNYKTKKDQEKARKRILEDKFINFDLIKKAINFSQQATDEKEVLNLHVEEYFTKPTYILKEYKNDLFDEIIKNQITLQNELLAFKPDENISSIQSNITLIDAIKKYLDSLNFLIGINRILNIPDDFSNEKNDEFYTELSKYQDDFFEISGLYNKVRNYLTKKPYSLKKFKLNFENSTLLNGWDANKEKDNFALIFKKDNNFYLGIMDAKHKKSFDKVIEPKENEEFYEKMYYKLLPGANKMLPKVFLSEKGKQTYKPNQKLIENYKNEKHKKGENFDISFCHELIDFFKNSIAKHPDWKNFDFEFSPTSSYKDISEFYREVESGGYKIEFKKFSESYIKELVNSGKLYLFWVYSKDFSHVHQKKAKKAKENLHTIYFRMLFDEKNLKNIVYKLNGEAEIFYRFASIPPKITHKANMPIANKRFGGEKTLPYDLIKNRRFSEDKFLFHFPITLNFNSENVSNINEKVNKLLHVKDNINIIGIDRGEKNLLYVVVINQRGEILHQESLNEIKFDITKNNETHKISTNYHAELVEKEHARQNARIDWKNIENIKELKAGYLSHVIHKLSTLMLEFNAVIVLEDLEYSFKQTRVRFEKQVYQKFEKALIEKLNFLVIKDKKDDELASPLKAIQLTNKFDDFKRLGKQSGFLFYIPAWNTSKIDPTTGFVKVLNTKYSNIEHAKKFFSTFDFISYNTKESYFEFGFDYEKFAQNGLMKSCEGRQKWVACTIGDTRYKYSQTKKTTKTYNVTKSLKELFEKYQVDISKKDLKEQIVAIDEADFFRWLFMFLDLTLTLRHSKTENGEVDDFILSPIKNKDGFFFDSRDQKEAFERGIKPKLPIDSDANGAYHIAQKGLWMIKTLQKQDEDKLKNINIKMGNKEWLEYMQK